MDKNNLRMELLHATKEHIARVERLSQLPKDVTLNQPNGSWSIEECCAHLVLYLDFYLVQLDALPLTDHSNRINVYKATFLGKVCLYMISNSKRTVKLKTAKKMNPRFAQMHPFIFSQLIQRLHTLASIIENSALIDYNLKCIRTSFAPSIFLNVGDTLRFLVVHNQWHLRQAERLA